MSSVLMIMASGWRDAVIQAEELHDSARPFLWAEPFDIERRDLYNGIGGAAGAPRAEPFRFIKEDMDGNSPKFVVEDADGVKWKVKLGSEARPETVVTRFVWATGYSTDEDYFLPRQRVTGLPKKLRRGGEYVTAEGLVKEARWERMKYKKISTWKWKHNPYSHTPELNGLRVLMAIFNNYDMKDGQNAIYRTPEGPVMAISDLGATLGPTASHWPGSTARGVLEAYRRSKFITKVEATTVSFAAPSWPMMYGKMPLPPLPYTVMTYPVILFGRTPSPNIIGERWIGRKIPKVDARRMGEILGRLSPAQLRAAFQSADYSPEEVEGFSQILEQRIAALRMLP
jgi:hypothetical protein